MSLKYVQTNTLYLAGSGVIIGATSITLTTFSDIYGNVLTMTDFGAKGYITLEPDTSNEEAATFTGVVANANSTYTLTGVSSVLAKSPYTETSGLVRAHSGGTKLVVTDNVAFWNGFANINNTNTFVPVQTFTALPTIPLTPSANTDAASKGYVDGVAVAGAPNASTTVKGIVEEATLAETNTFVAAGGTAARLFVNPSSLASMTTYAPVAAATATLDMSLGLEHRVTFPAGNITLAVSNDSAAQKFIVSLTQDSVGSRTVTWFSTIKWAGGVAPTLTTTANKRDTFGFIRTGSGTYDGFIVGQNI